MAVGATILLIRTPQLFHGWEGSAEILHQGQDMALRGMRTSA